MCPRVIRIDKGTENIFISECQLALRMSHEDSLAGEKSVRVGSSPTNSVSYLIFIYILSSIEPSIAILFLRTENRITVVKIKNTQNGMVD